MATSEKPKSTGGAGLDLVSVIRNSGILSERQLSDLRARILSGDLPTAAPALAERLVDSRLLTEYQAKRLLANKPHGLTVGKYVILDRIGSGSMGRVFKAHHQLMGRVVALKIIAPEILTNERALARFQREMRLVGRLDHPGVVRAFDADQVNGVSYIVMEYVQGRSLGQIYKSEGVFAPVDVVSYGVQAARGLAHAHAQGVVHRDIKPSNLMLNEEKQVKVLDLGLGVLMEADNQATFATADGIAVGTVDYMSPEQASGKEVDGRTDLYSLGCAMYHLVSGRLPFPGDSPIERLGKRINGRPVPLQEARADLPPGFIRVMDKLLAHHPKDRYQSGTEAADALESLLRRSTKKAVPAPVAPPADAEPATVVSQQPRQIVEVEVYPEYPAWFRPLAELAETRPKTALTLLLGSAAACIGLGTLLGWAAF
ncbi:serine/threonine-protein kinase [Isosphaeraceae bacterium EP7]